MRRHVSNKPPDNSDRAKFTRQIDEAFEDASKLAGSSLNPTDFYEKLLTRTLTAIQAPAGAVWLRTPQGFLQLAAQQNLEKLGLDDRRGGRQCHNEVLRQVFQATPPRPMLLEPQGRLNPNAPIEPGGVPAANLTDYYAIFAPIVGPEKTSMGLLEVFQESTLDPRLYQTYVQYAFQMAGYASQYHAFSGNRQTAGSEKAYSLVESFARLIHTTLNPTECAYHVANEGRKVIEADRLCVGVRHGSKTTVEAVSGADVVEKASTHVRRMQKLFDSVLKFNDKLVFSGVKDETLPPDVAKALDDYLAESQPKLLVVTPIRDEREKNNDKPARSVLLMEVFNPPEQTEALIQRLDVVGQHAASALYNAAELKRIPFKPLWWPVVKLQDGLGGKAKLYTILALIGIALLTLAMMFVPYPLKMDAKGSYMPVHVMHVFPGEEAQVEEIMLLPGQRDIKPGATVARLSSLTIRNKYEAIERELTTNVGKAEMLRLLKKRETTQDTQNDIQLAEAEAKVKQLTYQKNDLIAQYNLQTGPGETGMYVVRAPKLDKLEPRFQQWANITGSDVRETLTKRSMRPNEPIVKLGAVAGPWRVELKIPQRAIGHINKAFATTGQHQTETVNGKTVKYLPVDTLFSGYETESFAGKLYESDVHIEAVPNRDDHNETEPVTQAYVYVDLPQEKQEQFKKAGADVRVKVICGDRSLGYSLFHGVWEWFYEKVVFYF